MKARSLFFRIALAVALFGVAAPAFSVEKDTAYYRAAIGKSRYELKTALYNIIKDHTALKYDELWKAFETTDQRPDDDTLAWDIYSNCDFPFYAHYGPNTAEECYQLNREHSFPNSWFGGEATRKLPKYNDLFHMYPVSGRVNTIRNDNPYGKVQEGKANFVSSNGSLRGPSATPGFEGTVFEPIDEYKGDLARTYFYMVTRYEDEVADWDTVYNKGGEKACVVCNGTSTQAMQDWAVALFLEWHRLDPVSQKEIDRNDSIYTIQHNRNPFIDFPEMVEKIWGNDMQAFGVGNTPTPKPSPSREPEDYYKDAYGKSGYTLKTALHGIIKGHKQLSYAGLWEAYKKTDARADGKVWDMYSDCNFTFGTNQCGTYSKEGDCYNREHSFPKSWFNDAYPMYTDLFHLYPTDGYVNGRRSNYPFGEVSNPTYTSNNGGKLGPNTTSGYSGTVFEVVDEYKGDFARSYFYMATRYEDVIADWSACPICDGNNKATFKQWTVDLLLKWHEQDPVSEKEIARNDAVYAQQNNRNPFIDHPEMVEKIWGSDNTPFNVFEPEPQPEVNYTLPYTYRNAEHHIVFTDTLKVYSSNPTAKAQPNITITYPENDSKVYSNAVAGKVQLSGLEPEEINNTYSLAIVSLSYDTKYTLDVALLKNGEEVASATSSFETVDTVSVDPGHEMDPEKEYYMLPYAYKDGEGKVVRADTLYVPVPVVEKKLVEKVLWCEEFETFTGKDDATSPQASAEKCDYVESFEGTAITINDGVKLASGKKSGQIKFKKFDCSGDFKVAVDGKGWTEKELTCKILCDVCTVKEKTLTFTQAKETLSNGEYETLNPITFTVEGGQTEVALSILADTGKRVFIGKVEVFVGEEIGPDGYTGVSIAFPAQAEELLESLLVARASLDMDDEEGIYQAEHIRLPEMELEYGSAYSLEMELWRDEERINADTVDFSVKAEEIDPDPGPGPVVTPDTVKVPTFAPAGGEVEKGTKVTISCETDGATIYYTVNGVVPTAESTKYTTAISIDSAMIIKAIAVKEGMENSPMEQVSYTVKETPVTPPDPVVTPDTVETPTFAPEGGEVEKGTKVTISCETDGATIYYTKNGEVPTTGSTRYTAPIGISADLTIKAIAVKKGMEKSPVAEASYTIKETPVTPPDDTVAIETAEKIDFEVYPNPNRGDFYVDVPQGSRVEVFTPQGVLLQRLENVSGKRRLHAKDKGLYIVRVSVNGKTGVKRVIVE